MITKKSKKVIQGETNKRHQMIAQKLQNEALQAARELRQIDYSRPRRATPRLSKLFIATLIIVGFLILLYAMHGDQVALANGYIH